MRALAGDQADAPRLALYKRVLPLEYLACLAYEPLFRCVYHYVYALKYGVGKPLHAWELQNLLWAMSMHGRSEDRFRYLGAKLRGVILPRTRGRRPHSRAERPCDLALRGESARNGQSGHVGSGLQAADGHGQRAEAR
jgi:hypothetical protein